jgi:hypothetical protein
MIKRSSLLRCGTTDSSWVQEVHEEITEDRGKAHPPKGGFRLPKRMIEDIKRAGCLYSPTCLEEERVFSKIKAPPKVC